MIYFLSISVWVCVCVCRLYFVSFLCSLALHAFVVAVLTSSYSRSLDVSMQVPVCGCALTHALARKLLGWFRFSIFVNEICVSFETFDIDVARNWIAFAVHFNVWNCFCCASFRRHRNTTVLPVDLFFLSFFACSLKFEYASKMLKWKWIVHTQRA